MKSPSAALFLVKAGELPHEVESKLLRVLKQGRFELLGSTKPLLVSVRLIAATNRHLAQEVRKGNYRNDLYCRLSVFLMEAGFIP